jgi:ParB family chromosome partitioning protein
VTLEAITGEVVVPWTPQYAAGYVRESWQGAVESIIETGRRLQEAKDRVPVGKWLDAVELMPFGESTTKYLIQVAKHPVLSDRHYSGDLPASWRTLSLLAQLPAEEVSSLIASGGITPELQQAEAKTLVSASKGAIEPGAHVGQNSGDNEWYTPEEYIAAAVRVMGRIDLDPASSPTANDNIGAATFYTAQDNGLIQPWNGRLWMNPPYAQPLIGQFAERMVEQYQAGNVKAAIVLVNNGTETQWFQTLASVASAVCFPKGRIKFWHPDKIAVPLQGQAFLYLGDEPEVFDAEFAQFGFTMAII